MATLLQIVLSNAVVATFLALGVAVVSRFCQRPALIHTLWLLVLLKLITPALLTVPVNWPTELSPAGAVTDGPTLSTASGTATPLDTVVGWLERSCAQVALAVWFGGAFFWFALVAIRSVHFTRLLRFGQPAPRELQEQAQQLSRELGLRYCPRVWILPGVVPPMLWGLGRWVRLLVPGDLMARLNPEQLRTVLAHELAHARRRDPWVRTLELVVLGLYWWHPVAWWARRCLREAEEQCCDAWVIDTLPASAPSYATALLETVEFLSAARPALPPVASGISFVRLLKRRLTHILGDMPPRRISRYGWLTVLGLGLLLLPWRPVWDESVVEAAQPLAVPPPSAKAQTTEKAKPPLPRVEKSFVEAPPTKNNGSVAFPQQFGQRWLGWHGQGRPGPSDEWRTWSQHSWGPFHGPAGRGWFGGGRNWRDRL